MIEQNTVSILEKVEWNMEHRFLQSFYDDLPIKYFPIKYFPVFLRTLEVSEHHFFKNIFFFEKLFFILTGGTLYNSLKKRCFKIVSYAVRELHKS